VKPRDGRTRRIAELSIAIADDAYPEFDFEQDIYSKENKISLRVVACVLRGEIGSL
jgi:hypothetical protein